MAGECSGENGFCFNRNLTDYFQIPARHMVAVRDFSEGRRSIAKALGKQGPLCLFSQLCCGLSAIAALTFPRYFTLTLKMSTKPSY
jgi:hypothetical protein